MTSAADLPAGPAGTATGRMPTGETAPASEGTARRVVSAWDSAVTSYHLILGSSVLLVGIGLVMVLSSSSIYSLTESGGESPYTIFLNQARFAVLGLPVAWLASRLPVRFYKAVAWPALGFAALLQLLVFTPLGLEDNGNRNWLLLPGNQAIQPSEFGKIALAVWLGVVLSRKRHLLDRWAHVLVPAVLVGLVLVGLVLLGDDVGTASILVLILIGSLFVAGVRWHMFAAAIVAAGVGLGVAAMTGQSRIRRMLAFLDCSQQTQGTCYQSHRGRLGLGSGGLTGVGLGEGREKWSYLPEAYNDFVFAVIGEELGLLGALLVLGLFALLAIGMSRVVRRHTDPFVAITTGAIAAWILGQAVVNIGVVVGLLPVVGLPLPLVSAGGSALVATMLAIGIVLSFARAEPGAAQALAARPGVVRKSLAVVGRATGRRPRA